MGKGDILLGLLFVWACGCGGGSGGGADPARPAADDPAPPPIVFPSPSPPAPVLPSISYSESTADLLNPERGVYYWVSLLSRSGISTLRGRGATLGFASVPLGAYRDRPLDSAILRQIGTGLSAARAAGVKLVLRFAYSFGLSEPDAPKARILGHISQLAPLLRENADMLAVVQAGFIGAWGEWHHSSHGLDNPRDRSEILGALLDALPPSLRVQVRTPRFKRETCGGDPVPDADAYGPSPRARVGHHNDAFLASTTDMGTYAAPVAGDLDWLSRDSRYVPVGGETAAVNVPRSDGPSALSEMERLHWSFVSLSYHKDVLSRWQSQGALDLIRRRLGYRFHLVGAAWPPAVAPGGRFDLVVRVRNTGFASPYNERPVCVVLSGPGFHQAARIAAADPRRWEPGSEVELSTAFQVPASLPPGRYRLALWFPDPHARLADRAEYAIRLANDGLWDGTAGLNVLTDEFRVDPSAPGPVDPTAAEFRERP